MSQPKVRSATQPPRNHLEALLGRVAAGDFDVDAQAGAVLDDLGAVVGAGPSFGDAGVTFGEVRGATACTVQGLPHPRCSPPKITEPGKGIMRRLPLLGAELD